MTHTDVPPTIEALLADALQHVEADARERAKQKREQAEATRKAQEAQQGDLMWLLYQEYGDTLLPYFKVSSSDMFEIGDNDTRTIVLDLPRCVPIYIQATRHYRKPWAVSERAWRPDQYVNEWYTYMVATYMVSEDYELDGLHEDRFIVHQGKSIHTNDLTHAIGAAQIEEQRRVDLLAEAAEKSARYREHRQEELAAGRDWSAPAPPPPLTLSPAEQQMILAWRAMDAERDAYAADRYGEPEPRYE